MSDEDNKLFQTFGGRNKAIFVIVALLVAVAFFIAGAVMLGVGIHKANTKAVSCDNNKNNPVKTTAAILKTTKPAVGSTNNPNTATNTITTVSTSTKTPTIVAKPFYLSVVNKAITADQLKNDFAGSVQRFSDSITSQLDGHPSVTILSVTSSNAPQSFMSFAADDAPVVGLVAVVYTSDQNYGQDDITAAIKQNTNLDVPQIEDGTKLPPDSSDQLCNRVNPTTPATTQPTQPTLPSGQTTPSTKKSTVSASTRAPASDFHPCDNRIVFAIDLSGNNAYYKVLQNFLINYVFAGNWDHLERLGLLWYSNRVVARYPFGYFNDNTQKNLDYVRKNINSRSQVSGTNPNLQATFQALLDNYKTNNDFSSVRYVVFVSQKLTQVIVDGLKPLAQQLNDKGGLALIALGSNVDQGRKYLSQLSDKFTYWPAPGNNPVLPGWEAFFFNTAYGCEGTPPSDAPTIGTEPTITFGTTTTTQAPPPKPCDGRIVVMLDSGKSLTQTSFDQQKTFLGGKLFNAPTFDTYKRLALGYYGQLALTNDFGHVLNNDQVVGYLNSISYDGTKESKLRVALNTVAQKEYAKAPGAQVTVIIFVSYLTQDGVQDAKDEAAKIQQQGIRLILVAHGFGVTPDLLTQVTGDSKTVTQWPTSQTEIPNYNKWLSNALNCPNQS